MFEEFVDLGKMLKERAENCSLCVGQTSVDGVATGAVQRSDQKPL